MPLNIVNIWLDGAAITDLGIYWIPPGKVTLKSVEAGNTTSDQNYANVFLRRIGTKVTIPLASDTGPNYMRNPNLNLDIDDHFMVAADINGAVAGDLCVLRVGYELRK